MCISTTRCKERDMTGEGFSFFFRGRGELLMRAEVKTTYRQSDVTLFLFSFSSHIEINEQKFKILHFFASPPGLTEARARV
jgi:hypothetical protein